MAALALCGVAIVALAIGGKWWWDHRASFVRERTAAFEKALDADDVLRARAALDRLLERRPDLDDWRFERAELAMRDKRWDDAAKDFRVLGERGARPGAAATGLALVEALYDKRMPDAPSDAETTDARDLYYRGIVHQARRELEHARADTEHALSLDPDLVEARFALGGIKYRLGDIDGAEDAFRKYGQRRQRFETDMYLGNIDAQRANFESAESNFERATRGRPDNLVAWTNLAASRLMLAISWERNVGDWSRLRAEKLGQAKDDLAKARALEPTYFLVAFNDAILRIVSEERWSEEAEASYRDAVLRGGTDPVWGARMRIYYARTLHAYSDHDRALAHLDEARTSCPSVVHDYLWVYSFVDVARDLDRDADALSAIDVALQGAIGQKDREHLTLLRTEIAHRDE